MKQKQNITKLSLAFLALLTAFDAQAGEKTREGGLPIFLDEQCKELSDFTPDVGVEHNAIGVSDCSHHPDPLRKLSIFLSGSMKAYFDGLRVEGASAKGMLGGYFMVTFGRMDELEKRSFERDGDEHIEEARVLACAEMRRQGPPTYYPQWTTGSAPGSSGSEQARKLKEIDAEAEWDAVLTLFCPAK